MVAAERAAVLGGEAPTLEANSRSAVRSLPLTSSMTPPVLENEHSVAHTREFVVVRGRHDDGRAVTGCLAHERVDALTTADVDPSRRLLEKNDLRPSAQPAADHDPLAVAAAQAGEQPFRIGGRHPEPGTSHLETSARSPRASMTGLDPTVGMSGSVRFSRHVHSGIDPNPVAVGRDEAEPSTDGTAGADPARVDARRPESGQTWPCRCRRPARGPSS